VVGIVGIDGSPSCGVHQTIDVGSFARSMARVDPAQLTVRDQNDLVRRHATPGRGIFVEELERELAARGIDVPLLAHDLLAELDGRD
jgi:predicted secreted protein